jgi:hypothetical protein
MTTLGFDGPLYILPFDHRGSFQKKMFEWDGELNAHQTAKIASAERVVPAGGWHNPVITHGQSIAGGKAA